jgi:hypothetical protein
VLVVAASDGIHVGVESEGTWDWRVELAGHQVTAVVPDGGVWWALVDGKGLWRRSAGGVWASVTSWGQELTCLAVGRAGPLMGTAGAGLVQIGSDGQIGAVPAFAHAPTRDQWYTPWGGPPQVRSLALAGDGTWFANVHVGGILRSHDAGATWSATIDMHADVHQVICPRADQPGLVLAACADGLAISRDRGDSWRLRDEGLPYRYCRAVALVGDTVLVSVSKGPSGEDAQVLRAPLEGWARFQPCGPGFHWGAMIDTGRMASSGGQVALADRAGEILTSLDEGASWTEIARDLASPQWLVWV